jgi:hypothetical protein
MLFEEPAPALVYLMQDFHQHGMASQTYGRMQYLEVASINQVRIKWLRHVYVFSVA